MSKEDLTGKNIGLQTVIERSPSKNGKMMYKCQCSCGTIKDVRASSLRTGQSNSCGCVNKNNFFNQRKEENNKKESLIGKTFGKLIVIEDFFDEKGWRKQKCKCQCGAERICFASELSTGRIKSCGNEKCRSQRIDLTNQNFGFLTVIERTNKQNLGNQEYLQKCQCKCGSIVEVSTHNLISGHTVSCGCIKSKGELKISEILINNNIPFVKEYTFKDCYFQDSNRPAKFDFYVNNKYIIEFDGIQHYQYQNDTTFQNNEEHFKKLKEKDNFKNEYCRKNNIPLIRIPYTYLNNITINDLIPETSNFLI